MQTNISSNHKWLKSVPICNLPSPCGTLWQEKGQYHNFVFLKSKNMSCRSGSVAVIYKKKYLTYCRTIDLIMRWTTTQTNQTTLRHRILWHQTKRKLLKSTQTFVLLANKYQQWLMTQIKRSFLECRLQCIFKNPVYS